jgi:hypothetical protein
LSVAVVGDLVDDFHDLLEELHGVLLSDTAHENTATEVGSKFNDVSFLKPDLRGVLVGQLTLKELLREAAFHIDTLIRTEFSHNFG